MYLLILSTVIFLLPRILVSVKKYKIMLTKKMKVSRLLCGEDLYQKNKKEKHGCSYIYKYLELEKVDYSRIQRIIDYFVFYCQKYDIPVNFTVEKVPVIGCVSQLDKYYPNRGEYIKIVYNDTEIGMFFDHIYIGTEAFHCIGQRFFTSSTQALIKPTPPFPYQDLFTWKFILRDMIPKYIYAKDIHQPLPMYSKETDMNRIQITKNVVKNENSRLMNCIYNCFNEIFLRLPKHVFNIKAYITYGFQGDKTIYNNVGIIFVDICRKTTIKELEEQLKERRYQAVATNYLMRIIEKGKKTRNSVDVVLTIAKLTDLDFKIKRQFYTFKKQPDYPIYCLSFTLDEEQHIFMTSNTPALKINEEYEETLDVEHRGTIVKGF